jgi:hypothetical protein
MAVQLFPSCVSDEFGVVPFVGDMTDGSARGGRASRALRATDALRSSPTVFRIHDGIPLTAFSLAC